MLGPALAVAAASLAIGGPPTVVPELPVRCAEADDWYTLALACDPDGDARELALTLGTATTRHVAPGVRVMNSAEPLLPGETLTLTWRHPSSRAILAVAAKAPAGVRRVVLGLPGAPERVDVTAQADGGLHVVTPSAAMDVPAPRPDPADDLWHPRTARAAAEQLLRAVDRMDRSVWARKTLCAAMDRRLFSFFEPQVGVDRREYACHGILQLVIFADENVPKVVSTTHRGLTLDVRGGRAVASTRLVHRFERYDDPRRLAIRARVLLVRDGGGVWRLGTVSALLPLTAVDDPHHVDSDRDLARENRAFDLLGRSIAVSLGRLEAKRAAASVEGVAAVPCSPQLVSDRAGDVVVNGESQFHARAQGAHPDVDVIGFAAVGRCVVLRTTAPLPPTFTLHVDDQGNDRAFDVRVTAGRTLVEETTNVNDGVDPVPLRGVVAHLGVDGMALALPAELSGKVAMSLVDGDREVAYGDFVSSVPVATPRCARPTC